MIGSFSLEERWVGAIVTNFLADVIKVVVGNVVIESLAMGIDRIIFLDRSKMPFTQVSGRVTGGLGQFTERHLFRAQTVAIGPDPVAGRGATSHESAARWGTDRRSYIKAIAA